MVCEVMAMFDKKLFGNRLRYYRKNKKITLDTLAEKVGIEPQYLSSIEAGKHIPTLKIIISILNALNIDYSTLINATDYNCTITEQIIDNSKKLNDEEFELLSYYIKSLN